MLVTILATGTTGLGKTSARKQRNGTECYFQRTGHLTELLNARGHISQRHSCLILRLVCF
jgi:hypothetical protein